MCGVVFVFIGVIAKKEYIVKLNIIIIIKRTKKFSLFCFFKKKLYIIIIREKWKTALCAHAVDKLKKKIVVFIFFLNDNVADATASLDG